MGKIINTNNIISGFKGYAVIDVNTTLFNVILRLLAAPLDSFVEKILTFLNLEF